MMSKSITKNMQKWKLPDQPQDPVFQRTYLRPLFLQVRCPGCNKLYRIDTRDVKSRHPHFDCVACHTQFTLEGSEQDPDALKAKTLSQVKFSPIANLNFVEKPEGLKSCPKCKAFNPKLAEECRGCGVIFAKLENLPLEAKTGALPSLVKAWQDLMEDYSNVTKHLAFVDRCDDLQAVPFALKKYQDLKEAQPHDEIAQQMFHRVMLKSFAKKAEVVTAPSMQILKENINWPRIVRIGPLVLSLLLIIAGAAQSASRNMIGIGVSILFITLGLALFTKGRIHWQDFWE